MHPAARKEFAAAALYYEEQSPGMGARFANAFERVVDIIEAHPYSGVQHADEPQARLWRIDGFPYSVIYAFPDDGGAIYAVAHTSRDPRYWIGRLYS